MDGGGSLQVGCVADGARAPHCVGFDLFHAALQLRVAGQKLARLRSRRAHRPVAVFVDGHIDAVLPLFIVVVSEQLCGRFRKAVHEGAAVRLAFARLLFGDEFVGEVRKQLALFGKGFHLLHGIERVRLVAFYIDGHVGGEYEKEGAQQDDRRRGQGEQPHGQERAAPHRLCPFGRHRSRRHRRLHRLIFARGAGDGIDDGCRARKQQRRGRSREQGVL